MRRSTRGVGAAVVLLAVWAAPFRGTVLLAAATAAQIKLVPPVGPPTTPLTVKGRGFGNREVVDITFDSVPAGSATTSMAGKFKAAVEVPDSALPGDHTVQATGEDSGSTGQATFLVRTDWPKFHFDLTNSGLNPYENVLSPLTVSGLTQAWVAPAPGYVNTGPVLAGGIVYIGVSGIGGPAWLMAVDADTGERVWLRQDFGGTGFGSPTVADGVVYLGTNSDHALHAYDAVTGADVWTFTAGGGMSSPAVFGGIVYSNSSDGYLYAIDERAGTQIWKAATGTGSPLSAPAVAAGRVYVGSGLDGRVVAIDSTTGAQAWSYSTNGEVQSTPSVVNGVVYIGSRDTYVYALDAATGGRIWRAHTSLGVSSSPAVADGVVYVGSDDFSMYAFDAETGAQLWKVPTGYAIGLGAASVANGVVYFGSEDDKVYALDAVTGSVLWTATTGGDANRSPAVADGTVYIGSFDQNLYAFRLP